MKYYYVDAKNEAVGPLDKEGLRAHCESGKLFADSLISPEGDSDWQPYSTILLRDRESTSSMVPVLPSHLVKRTARVIALPSPTKLCPFCAESIAAAAKKCKHCGETLDVTLRAAQEAQRMAQQQPTVYMNAGGGAVSANEQVKRYFPHILHFFATIFTGGLWLIIWILHYLFRDRNYYQ